MRACFFLILLGCRLLAATAQLNPGNETRPGLDYYLPQEVNYDNNVPVPESVTGHQVGAWHLTHDKLVWYLQELAASSERVVYEEYARSHENRPLFHLYITSPGNHARLEEIRQEHLSLCDPDQPGGKDYSRMPLVVRLGYGVHGNESSASNASVLVAYYLAAAQGEQVEQWLEEMVVMLDPCLNPDGFNRHASWINMHRSKVPVADAGSRGFREVWPGGRTNHYWFDLNRDWILVQHPESKGRVQVFHRWKPNVVTDHHEMGSSSTFFFQPGIPSRTNPHTPQATTALTRKIADYHARALDEIGTLYFTEERFDDFYYGKGSSYPDVNGSVGILFEQAGTRGFVRNTPRGELTFPYAIKNQVAVSMSSLEASSDLREELLEHQENFYRSAIEEAEADPVKAYVFGERNDATRLHEMVDILLQHQIDVRAISSPVDINNVSHAPGEAFLVACRQPQYRLIRSFFEPALSFEDSLFYDVSAWTLPHAMNLPCTTLASGRELNELSGGALTAVPEKKGQVHGTVSRVGYLFEWKDYQAAAALWRIQDAGLMVNLSHADFRAAVNGSTRDFFRGSIFVPAGKQPLDEQALYRLMEEVAETTGIDIHALASSYTLAGADLGSNNISPISKPEVLLLTGSGVRSTEAGEVWHLLDTRVGMPVTLAEQGQLDNLRLSQYNTLIMPSGYYRDISQEGIDRVRDWIAGGGTLIAINRANEWLRDHQLVDLKIRRSTDDTGKVYEYSDLYLNRGAQYIAGTIFEAHLDITHPIGYGHTRTTIPVFRNSNYIIAPTGRPYAEPVRYTGDPLLSGYVSSRNYDALKGVPAVVVSSIGSGKLISFVDNPNFRGIWYGTNRLFINAVFFGQSISTLSTR